MDSEYLIQRITRDITDGLLLVDLNGTIKYINPQGKEILNDPDIKEGIKFAQLMKADRSGLNDEFYQYLLDSIYDKKETHSGALTYRYNDGNIRYFNVKSSFVFSDDEKQKLGVILQFSDVTKARKMRIRYSDAVKVLVAMIIVLSVNNIIVKIWDTLDQPLDASYITLMIEIVGVIGTLMMLKHTSLTVHDLGLGKGTNLKKTLIIDAGFTLLILAFMIAVKLIIQRVRPDIIAADAPLFHWKNWELSSTLYPLTVFAQELMTRGAAQGCLTMVLPEKTPGWVPITVSSLFFGALHIHKDLVFMIGAMILLSIFGFIYNKQKTIWGLCIPHYILGLSIAILWGFKA